MGLKANEYADSAAKRSSGKKQVMDIPLGKGGRFIPNLQKRTHSYRPQLLP